MAAYLNGNSCLSLGSTLNMSTNTSLPVSSSLHETSGHVLLMVSTWMSVNWPAGGVVVVCRVELKPLSSTTGMVLLFSHPIPAFSLGRPYWWMFMRLSLRSTNLEKWRKGNKADRLGPLHVRLRCGTIRGLLARLQPKTRDAHTGTQWIKCQSAGPVIFIWP